MPKTGPCRSIWCLQDSLVITQVPVKFGHASEWISDGAGKFASRTRLLAEEQRA